MKNGDRVMYVGDAMELGYGAIGTYAELPDYCLYCGEFIRMVPGFIDANGTGFYVWAPEELELF
jgi:hypothetical protein